MPEIKEAININANIAKVRGVFQDFANYSKWTSFILSIEVQGTRTQNTIEFGDSLKVTMLLPNSKKPSVFDPTVLTNNETEFTWKGTLFSEYLFAGKHTFKFKSIENDTKTEVIQSEDFTGILSKPLLMFIGKDTAEGFKAFNGALKSKCEKL
jgi:hypothetical protein